MKIQIKNKKGRPVKVFKRALKKYDFMQINQATKVYKHTKGYDLENVEVPKNLD